VERTLLVKGLSSGKLVPKYIGPVKIIAVLGNDRYRVASFSKDRRRFKGVVASDRLKLFVGTPRCGKLSNSQCLVGRREVLKKCLMQYFNSLVFNQSTDVVDRYC
jgi:hypothetical protein